MQCSKVSINNVNNLQCKYNVFVLIRTRKSRKRLTITNGSRKCVEGFI